MSQEWRRTNELLLRHGRSLVYRPISKRCSGLYLLYRARASSQLRLLIRDLPIPREGTESDRDLLGSGSPSTGLKNRRRAVGLTDSIQHIQLVYTYVWRAADRNNYSLLLIPGVNKFCALNFRGWGRLRKYFNNENFPMYGTSPTHFVVASWDTLHSGHPFRKPPLYRSSCTNVNAVPKWPA